MNKSKVSKAAKEATKRIDAALQKAEPVADSLLTRLVKSPHTVPWLLLMAACCVVAIWWLL